MEGEFGFADLKSIQVACWFCRDHLRSVNVSYLTASIAYQVMMSLAVRIKPAWARSNLQLADLAHRHEIVERLVHRAERNCGQGHTHLAPDFFGRGMSRSLCECTKDALSLRCNVEALLTE